MRLTAASTKAMATIIIALLILDTILNLLEMGIDNEEIISKSRGSQNLIFISPLVTDFPLFKLGGVNDNDNLRSITTIVRRTERSAS